MQLSDEQKQSSLGKKAADVAKIVADKKLGKYKRKIIVKVAKWIVAGCTAIAGICAPIFAFIYLPLIYRSCRSINVLESSGIQAGMPRVSQSFSVGEL